MKEQRAPALPIRFFRSTYPAGPDERCDLIDADDLGNALVVVDERELEGATDADALLIAHVNARRRRRRSRRVSPPIAQPGAGITAAQIDAVAA